MLNSTGSKAVVEPSIGEQELALLRHIADAGSITVGEAADAFGAPRALARATVLTMMERLRGKGHLARRLVDGVYRYRARASSAELLKSAVQRFVERNLDGSVSPFLAYLSEAGRLTDDELHELEEIVARLHADRGKDR
jgi:predicted transcriptional regulator